MWLLLCGILSLVVSVCLGLCLDGLLTCLHVGGHLADEGVLFFGKWNLFVSSGAFGGKETIGVLKTWKEPWKRLFIVGLWLMSILCLSLFLTFSLAFLFLVRCFPCILPVY
jgi:hypothetical protein